MAEEEQNPESVFSTHVTGPAETPAMPATAGTQKPQRTVFILAGIIVLVVIVAVALLVSGVLDFSPDPVIGTWTAGPGNLQMQCAADGSAMLRNTDTGTPVSGKWQKVAENRYQFVSATGTKSPLLVYDPISDVLRTADYSLVFARKG
jgi:hypothetical protein